MKLVDPTAPSAALANARAPKLASLEGLTIGLLSNRKLNADLMLRETAALFAERHGCRVATLVEKNNASAPAGERRIAALIERSDFLITGLGD
jgi:hypothetical protein